MNASTHLLIIAEREALAWIVGEERMAFPATRAKELTAAAPGDRLLLYTTRGCFHNPTRDRGRIVGEAALTSPVDPLSEAVLLAGRTFELGCSIEVFTLAPLMGGIELAPLVEQLRVFPDPRSWPVHMRRPLLTLPEADARLLRESLAKIAEPADRHRDSYAALGSVR